MGDRTGWTSLFALPTAVPLLSARAPLPSLSTTRPPSSLQRPHPVSQQTVHASQIPSASCPAPAATTPPPPTSDRQNPADLQAIRAKAAVQNPGRLPADGAGRGAKTARWSDVGTSGTSTKGGVWSQGPRCWCRGWTSDRRVISRSLRVVARGGGWSGGAQSGSCLGIADLGGGGLSYRVSGGSTWQAWLRPGFDFCCSVSSHLLLGGYRECCQKEIGGTAHVLPPRAGP